MLLYLGSCFCIRRLPGSPLRFNLCAFAPLRHARIATRSVAGGSLREIFSLWLRFRLQNYYDCDVGALLQHSNTPTPQHPNTPTLQHSNTPTLQHSNTPTLQHSNTPTLQYSSTPSLRATGFEDSLSDEAYALCCQPLDSRPRKRGALHNRDVGEVGRTTTRTRTKRALCLLHRTSRSLGILRGEFRVQSHNQIRSGCQTTTRTYDADKEGKC